MFFHLETGWERIFETATAYSQNKIGLISVLAETEFEETETIDRN